VHESLLHQVQGLAVHVVEVEEVPAEGAAAVPDEVAEVRAGADVVAFPQPADDAVAQFLGAPYLVAAFGRRPLGRGDALRRQRDERRPGPEATRIIPAAARCLLSVIAQPRGMSPSAKPARSAVVSPLMVCS
jgi:hypothetical protein